jgi:predicted membrane protein
LTLEQCQTLVALFTRQFLLQLGGNHALVEFLPNEFSKKLVLLSALPVFLCFFLIAFTLFTTCFTEICAMYSLYLLRAKNLDAFEMMVVSSERAPLHSVPLRGVKSQHPQSPKSEYHTRPTFSRFRLYNPSGVTISHSDWPVHCRTSDNV